MTRVFLTALEGEGFAEPNPRPMFPNPPGLLRLEPHATAEIALRVTARPHGAPEPATTG